VGSIARTVEEVRVRFTFITPENEVLGIFMCRYLNNNDQLGNRYNFLKP
jgi:hypothetical protein